MKKQIEKNKLIKTFDYIYSDKQRFNSVIELLNRQINELQNIKLFFNLNESLNVFDSFEKLNKLNQSMKKLLS